MKYTVAKVSNQIQGNHIAWSIPITSTDSLLEANEIADKEYQKLVAEFEKRSDLAEGAVMGETIIVHNGEDCF